jgi:outer membrane cobalamin receptor
MTGTYPADQDRERNILGASIISGEARRLRFHYYRIGTSESYASAGTTYVHEGLLHGAEIGVSWLAPDSARTAFGAGFKARRLESSSLGDRTSTDFYAHALKERRSERSAVQGSVRLEKSSGFDADTAAGLAARIAPRRGVLVFSRLERSYRFPTFHALYNGGNDSPADSRVGTETSWSLELGATIEKGPLSVSFSGFRRVTDGSALWLTDDSCGACLDPDVETAVTGLETSLRVRMQPSLEAEISYSALRARDGSGARPAYIPSQTVMAVARLRKRLSRHICAGVTFAGRYVPSIEAGARLEPCENNALCIPDAELPGNVSAMLSIQVDIDRVATYFKIRNLTNDTIKTAWGRPGLPSRSYEFGTSWYLLD